MMSPELKQFILKNIGLLNQNTKESWEEIYKKINVTQRGEFTKIILDARINDPAEKLQNIPNFYLSESNIKYYNVPLGIKNIGRCAFQQCDELLKVEVSEGVQFIEEYAFFQCGLLERIILPSSLKYIGENTFNQCYSLNQIEYNSTKENWDKIVKEDTWRINAFIKKVICTDGIFNI